MREFLKEYQKIIKKINETDKNKIPLCAAETYTSKFSLEALNSTLEGMYGFSKKEGKNNFIGGDLIIELKKLANKICEQIFFAKYINLDSFTGMNCLTYTIMALLSTKDKLLITTPDQGGHPSLPVILKNLNIEYDEIPYDFDNFQIDYTKTNSLLNSKKYSAIIFCQSDILCPPDLSKLHISDDIIIIYDATQTLGLIAGKVLPNPLQIHNKLVLIGGVHKTLPGPSCGLIMSNSDKIIDKLENKLSPGFIRYCQPNHIAGLILALIEFHKFGSQYCEKIYDTNKKLGDLLIQHKFKIAKISNTEYSRTHQIFMLTSREEMELMFNNAHRFNITLNKKEKKLFDDCGIRLGVQQICQYDWKQDELEQLAELLFLINQQILNFDKIAEIRKNLISKKIPMFSYDNCTIE